MIPVAVATVAFGIFTANAAVDYQASISFAAAPCQSNQIAAEIVVKSFF